MQKVLMTMLLVAAPAWCAGSACESLQASAVAHGAITVAETVAAGQFTPPGPAGPGGGAIFKTLPAFCRVAATLRPVEDSEIDIEVWMPATGWNGKLEAVGNGAWAGSISYAAMAAAVAAGYAATSTDTGHKGNAVTFVVGHPEKLVDFACARYMR